MKKLISVLLAAAMLLTLAACGGKKEETETAAKNEITELLDTGYECTMSTCDETVWKGVFEQEGNAPYMVTADMTAEQYEEYSNIPFDDEEKDAKEAAILGALQNVVLKDISDMIPTQEELDAYIGKTIGDLEDAGFSDSGYMGGEGEDYCFFYDGPVYSCTVTPAPENAVKNIDDYSANDIRGLVIGSVEYTGLSGSILD